MVEVLFAYNGIGKRLVDAIFARDYPIVQAAVLVIGVVVIVVNLLGDVLVRAIDRARREDGRHERALAAGLTLDVTRISGPAHARVFPRAGAAGRPGRRAGPVAAAQAAVLDGGIAPGQSAGHRRFGRDMLSRTLEGGRVSLEVGLLAATGAVIIGTALGVISGFWGGWFDRMVTAFADIWLAFPFMVLALAAVAVVGSDLPVLIGLLILGGWVLRPGWHAPSRNGREVRTTSWPLQALVLARAT